MAGVEPISKRTPDREELPPRAVPYCLRLVTAYVLYVTHNKKPEAPGYPKTQMLKGINEDDAGNPMFTAGIIRQLTGEMVSREEIHRWIQATGEKSVYQFLPIDSDQRALSTREREDFSKLATREQLITAFGNFTGMDLDWFNNIKDTPALSKARKVRGQGGKGHIAEPLFCPYEVMLWLIDPKRRKGRERQPLGVEKAWQLLEDHFPMVYAVHSIGDPRQPD